MRKPSANGAVGAAILALMVGALDATARKATAVRVDLALEQGAATDPRFIGRLRGDGRRLAGPDGATFDWRGITAFRLLELVAHGKAREAEAYLDFAARHRVTVVRVLARAQNLFDLPSEDGRAALPRLLEMARQRGIYLQVVALVDTAGWSPDQLASQLDEVARILEPHDNAILEYANEPYHGSQSRDLGRFVREHRTPFGGVWAQGAARDDASDELAAGPWVSVHVSRGGDRWRREARNRVLVDLSRRTGKFVVSNEPIGAGTDVQPGRRDNLPAAFAAQALLARLMGVGSTFHYEGGLQARIPQGAERACFDAWRDGLDAIPHDLGMRFTAAGEEGSPARQIDRATAEAVYTAASDARGWAVALGTRGPARIEWAPGWQVQSRRPFGEVELLRLTR